MTERFREECGFALDYTVVTTPDGTRHARISDVPILLCGRDVPDGSREDRHSREFDCPECRREAELRGDRSIGVVEA